MDWRDYYLREVLPKLDLPLAERYPLVSLAGGDGFLPLGEKALLMLVALTGTGKSTTLDLLRARVDGAGMSHIPSRRELADWIAIPMAQALADDAIKPIKDRRQRFAYTRRFAEQVPGGMAAVFSWLAIGAGYNGPLLSEGIRGENEIRYALVNFPRWRIVELTLHPLTRLRRLSGRRDAFDQTGGRADVSFLPSRWQSEARAQVNSGEITGEALAIVQAEAANYGFDAFADGRNSANYHRVAVDDLSPEEVAAAVLDIMAG